MSDQPEHAVSMSRATAIEQLRSAMEGQAPWSVRLGYGTSVFFDFGARQSSEVPGSPDRGSDQLWIYSAAWRLYDGGRLEAGTGDDDTSIANAFRQLVGRMVKRVVLNEHLCLAICFDHGKTLALLTLSWVGEGRGWVRTPPGPLASELSRNDSEEGTACASTSYSSGSVGSTGR